MTVYIDVVLIENIAMNYIILLATGLIGNRRVCFFKVLISSIIGGIYSIVNYVLNVSFIINIGFKKCTVFLNNICNYSSYIFI